jgi:hypothetical protein
VENGVLANLAGWHSYIIMHWDFGKHLSFFIWLFSFDFAGMLLYTINYFLWVPH